MDTDELVPSGRSKAAQSVPALLRLRRPTARNGGFTLIEVVIAGVAMVVALSGFSSAILSGVRVVKTSRRSAIGMEITQSVVETLSNEPFSRVFAAYNDDVADDLGGPAPGATFAVARSSASENEVDGLIGTIHFPVDPAAPGVLREDIVDRSLGMPRDLNGDGIIDGLDHSSDYKLLPVRVQVQWPSGGRSTLFAMLGGA